MRKRERENPCGVCGHYHKYEEGEMCPVCGHRPAASLERPIQQSSAFPSEILKDFLYLGSYDNASRGELLKTLGISRILNTVPACQNLYKNSFTYHCLQDDKSLPFDDAIQFIEQCEKDKARILVHCMSGKIRSPAIVVAYLMKCKGWRLQQSFQWVKDRRLEVDLSAAVHQQLVEFEQKVFGSNVTGQLSAFPSSEMVPSFGFRISNQTSTSPTFNQPASASIFDRTNPSEFVFGAGKNNEQTIAANNSLGITLPAGNEAPMDSF